MEEKANSVKDMLASQLQKSKPHMDTKNKEDQIILKKKQIKVSERPAKSENENKRVP